IGTAEKSWRVAVNTASVDDGKAKIFLTQAFQQTPNSLQANNITSVEFIGPESKVLAAATDIDKTTGQPKTLVINKTVLEKPELMPASIPTMERAQLASAVERPELAQANPVAIVSLSEGRVIAV